MTRPSLLARMRGLNQRSLFGPGQAGLGQGGLGQGDPQGDSDLTGPASTARVEAIQRLQIGFFGIGAMVLLVGLASIIGSQADMAEQAAVPEAAPTTEPTAVPTQANPLADAGVVPDIAVQPSPSPAPSPLDLPPLQPQDPGNAAPAQ
jgi:hypothetical protein